MTQKDKKLLLKELCARVPYRVKVRIDVSHDCFLIENITTLFWNPDDEYACINDYKIDSVKPYLFPMSSMTEEQRNEFLEVITPALVEAISDCVDFTKSVTLTGVKSDVVSIDWLNKNHFDYNDLISKGLAIDATGLNIY